jgi:hypothetical protein
VLRIPASVEEIGESAFRHTDITGLIFEEGSKLKKIGDWAFAYTRMLRSTVVIPDGVEIAEHQCPYEPYPTNQCSKAFEESLVTIVNPGATPPSCDALGGDGKLAVTKLHEGIPTEHYYKCDKLKEVEFHPEFYGMIGPRAFAETTELKASITIPVGATHIYDSAFEKSAITGLAFAADSRVVISKGAFKETAALSQAVTIPNGVEEIEEEAFANSAITGLVFASESWLYTIGKGAFKETAALSQVITIPKRVKEISESAFEDSAITGLTFPAGTALETINAKAFKGTSISQVAIPASDSEQTIPFVAEDAFDDTVAFTTTSEGLKNMCTTLLG